MSSTSLDWEEETGSGQLRDISEEKSHGKSAGSTSIWKHRARTDGRVIIERSPGGSIWPSSS